MEADTELAEEMLLRSQKLGAVLGVAGHFDYSPESLSVIDGALRDVRTSPESAAIVSAYVGEVLRRAVNGRWARRFEPPYPTRSDRLVRTFFSRLFHRPLRPSRPVICYVLPGGIKWEAGTAVKKPLFFDPAQLVSYGGEGQVTLTSIYEDLMALLAASPRERARGDYIFKGKGYVHDGHRYHRAKWLDIE